MLDRSAELPPSANRGVQTYVSRTNTLVDGVPFGTGVDYLTLTMGLDVSAELLTCTELVERFKGQQGFKQVERRVCMGGQCSRRFEPVTPSRRWACGYESWEWSGSAAPWPAMHLRGKDCRPSRVDVAFDFSVSPGLLADDVLDRARPTAEQRGLKLGIAGEDGQNTRYIGAIGSQRRIRIYRKDFEDEVWKLLYGPVLRVELVLKDDKAEDWWAAWCVSQDGAMREAAGHILEMTGFSVMDHTLPPTELHRISPAFEAAHSFRWALKQFGPVLDVAFATGIDLVALAAERSQNLCRTAKWRRDHLQAEVEKVGIEEVERAMRLLLSLDD